MSQEARLACPCGTGLPQAACCGVYLEGAKLPPTAEALMRSRYTAYVRRRADYLLATWDPATRPRRLGLHEDRSEWLGLQILRCEAGTEADREGRVEFIARYRAGGREHQLREDSRFRRDGRRWLYVDGQVNEQLDAVGAPAPAQSPAIAAEKVGRNDPCPCGSGLKHKRCCGA